MSQFMRLVVCTLMCAVPVHAAALSVSSATALQDSGVVTVTVTGSGGELIQGVGLMLFVGTGGPTAGGADQPGAPVITGGDIAADGPFGTNNAGNQFFNDLGGGPEKWIAGNYVLTQSGTVALDGPVATFTISTVNAVPGVYPLTLHAPDTTVSIDGQGVTPTLHPGSITILAASSDGGGTPPSPSTDPTPPPVTPPSDPVTEPVDPEEPASPDTPTDNISDPDPVVTPDTPSSPGSPGAEPQPVGSGGEGGADLDSDQGPTLAPRMSAPGTCAAGIIEGLVMSLLGLWLVRKRG